MRGGVGRARRAAVEQGVWFKGRQFAAEVIVWAVRWYLMFPISYRDLELMRAGIVLGLPAPLTRGRQLDGAGSSARC
jgi:hypothetical protein